jgi:hypothetical protein
MTDQKSPDETTWWRVDFSPSPAKALAVTLSLSEVDCLHVLWNETVVHLWYFVLPELVSTLLKVNFYAIYIF